MENVGERGETISEAGEVEREENARTQGEQTKMTQYQTGSVGRYDEDRFNIQNRGKRFDWHELKIQGKPSRGKRGRGRARKDATLSNGKE